MDVQPLAGALGAEIRGVDLRQDRDWPAIHAAFLEYSVLAIRDQELEPADLMRVGAHFGEPCHYPFVTGIEGFPFIFEVVKEESETVNFGGNWHSDTTYLAQPPLATLLYALETPTHGGDTLFTNTQKAYEALSEGMRALVDQLVGVNSASLKVTGGRRKIHAPANVGGMKIHDIENADGYEAEHPVVRTHPETGRKALYLSRSHTIRFRDMSEEESRPLIDFLQAHQTRPEFTCRVRWSPGTLTIWDNRCTQHNAVNDYHGQRRRMRRLTVGAQTPR
ncbi:MAG TPA: TauD/TfdA family dioxygenase [Burkholderiales bacterium]|nr:TauD/TfdA family dioxygenase [Burkholderiales bacterium]